MLGHIPIELVGAMLQTAAELYLVSDRATVLNIAKSCSIGYTYAIPILYRTLVIDGTNSHLFAPVFNESVPFRIAGGLLSRPATERLCWHVRRLFLGINQMMDPLRFGRLFPQLQAIFGFGDLFLTESDYGQLPSSLRSFHALSIPHVQWIPPPITHLCIFWQFGHLSVNKLVEWFEARVSDTVTHVALELNDDLEPDQEEDFVVTLRYLLGRSATAPVVIRIYSDAINAISIRIMLRTIGNMDAMQRQRVLIWRDEREIRGGFGDINTSKLDAVCGRTPWSEALPETQNELDAAMAD